MNEKKDGEKLTFAIDFDGTIVDKSFPDIGNERESAVETMKQLQDDGHKIVLWTARSGEYKNNAVEWLKEKGFTPDAVNKNPKNCKVFSFPKVFADVYIDDRNFPPMTNWKDVKDKYLKKNE